MEIQQPILILSTLILLLASTNKLSSQKAWDGGASTTLWSDANNWAPDGVPVSTDEVTIGAFSVDINGTVANAKSLTLTGSTLALNATGILLIDIGDTYALTIDGATLTNNGDIQLTNCSGGIGLQGTNSTLTNDGSITVNNFSGAGLQFVSGSTNPMVVNYNSMSFDNGTNANLAAIFYQLVSGTFTNDGTVTIGATAHAGPGINLGLAGGTYNNNGTTNISSTGAGKAGVNSGFIPGTLNIGNFGTFNFNAGIGGDWVGGFNLNLNNDGDVNLHVTSAVNVIASGSGTFAGTNEFSSTNMVAPGSSAGCLAFSTGYSNSGNTTIEIGGTTACSQHDKINVTGTANISGSLTISLINGFTLTAGQNLSFTVLEATNLSGTFSSISYPSGSNINWTTSYSGTSVIVNAEFPLPVELAEFTAEPIENKAVRLDWRTASETNNGGFFIEKSSDGRLWDNIGFEEGQGNSHVENAYVFLDEKPIQGMNYYRLRQKDFDGKEELSKVVSLDFSSPENMESLSIFPNPTKGSCFLKGEFPPESSLRIIDSMGRLVKQQKSIESQAIDLSSLKNGLYLIQISNPNKTISRRVIKQN